MSDYYTVGEEGPPVYVPPASFKPITVDFELADVDPEVLALVFGTPLQPGAKQTVAVEVHAPIKRTFWQWLRRRPRRWAYICVPNARLTEEDS